MILTNKTKLLGFQGKYRLRGKIVCGNKSTELVNVFNYLGCLVSFDVTYDFEKKISI